MYGSKWNEPYTDHKQRQNNIITYLKLAEKTFGFCKILMKRSTNITIENKCSQVLNTLKLVQKLNCKCVTILSTQSCLPPPAPL